MILFDRDQLQSKAVRLALGAVGLSVALVAVTAARAVRIDPTAPAPAASAAPSPNWRLDRPAVQVDPAAVAESDIFSPDRTAPSLRYLLPGEEVVSDEQPETPPVIPVVLGTAVSADGNGFATVQHGNERPRIVRPGDRVGEYAIVSIARGKVTFRRPDRTTFDVSASR